MILKVRRNSFGVLSLLVFIIFRSLFGNLRRNSKDVIVEFFSLSNFLSLIMFRKLR